MPSTAAIVNVGGVADGRPAPIPFASKVAAPVTLGGGHGGTRAGTATRPAGPLSAQAPTSVASTPAALYREIQRRTPLPVVPALAAAALLGLVAAGRRLRRAPQPPPDPGG